MFACCDESGIHGGSRWWIVGSMWLPDDAELARYEAEVTRLRQETNCWGEFKWTAVDHRWVYAYERFLALTLGLSGLAFRAIVVDTDLFTKEDMAKYHPEGGRDEAYLKFVRNVLRGGLRRFVAEGHREFTILYDRRSIDQALVRKFLGYLRGDLTRLSAQHRMKAELKHACSVDSATLALMQATDLCTGAVWSAWRGGSDSSANRDAREAIRSLLSGWSRYGLQDTGQPHDDKYDLWEWKP